MASILSELKEEGFILPDFKNSSFEASKQIGDGTNGGLVGKSQRKVLILIDGLGYNLLERVTSKTQELKKNMVKFENKKVTTLFPSTTINILSSIYGGITPAEHGLIGTNLFIKESGVIINSLYMTSAMDSMGPKLKINPLDLYPKGKLMGNIKARNKKAIFLTPKNLVGSGLSVATLGPADIVPYLTFDDMLVKITKLMSTDDVDYVLAYCDTLDTMEHQYDPSSLEVEQSLYTMLQSITKVLFKPAKENGFDIVVTSDHGHVKVTQEDNNVFTPKSEFNSFLEVPIWGEPRAAFLAVKENRFESFERYFERNFLKIGKLVNTDDAIKAGLFGSSKINKDIRYRFGTHIIIPRENKCIQYLFPGMEEKPFKSKGRHGGMESDEMYVPLLVY
jgi:predicted AlkP superfamily pyrophosphatase or phosphodiesterase